ncbi:lysis protein A [Cronobacter phage JC01]|uniref:Lysis protein A n=1 Tax=Cronobacter phage JC01 TaxID=2729575 RepID=A0A6M3YNN6_9CAUD|nr:endolysin [Cronobacter phage JC01]QJI52255.1 lysis protein A [Cronobacter phage JC01]
MPKYTEYFGNASLPRGIRNNNPGNIEWGSPWQGLAKTIGRNRDDRFAQFVDPASGIRAIAVTLITYYDKRKAKDGSRIDSVREVIDRWAPPVENNVSAYAKQVAAVLNVRPEDETLNLHNYDTMRGLVEGIIRHENGDPKKAGVTPYNNANQWYPDEVIDEALRRAGLVKKVATVGSVPATKTTAAAGTVAAIGVGQLAEVSQPVIDAVRNSQDNITSGQWTRIAFGVVTIGIGAWLTYLQYRKYKAGQAV